MPVEKSLPTDLEPILAVTRAAGVFTAEETDTVAELFNGYVQDPRKSGYNFLTYREQAAVLGFACWGPTPLTQGTVDLYWICAAPAAQGKGVGAALFQAVVAAARQAGRWLIVIWTSNRSEYAPARNFYKRLGCTLNLQLADFYARGEDLCMFTYRLD